MSYSYGAQAGEVTVKQVEVNQSTTITESKIPTVAEYKIASVVSDKAAALKGTVSPTAQLPMLQSLKRLANLRQQQSKVLKRFTPVSVL
ncbi:MAG: hypothetical protein DCF19_13955 [Pseudanabaena frigida]|uniref:Uncharacterized protein n=1 Tax=Pseudanabaena frigida TaxID=945775 RepID=A0A2W4Y7Z2_9CYAN|nr:MAG: hypothetical protein DCF19_13955 [Pseudanabaena frigida]